MQVGLPAASGPQRIENEEPPLSGTFIQNGAGAAVRLVVSNQVCKITPIRINQAADKKAS